MPPSLRLSSLSGIAGLALAIFSCPACGGNEPAPQAPAPPAATHADAPARVSTSAEIGGLNEEKVDKTFQRALSDFQRCLDDGAKRVEFLGGSARFFLKIDAEGKVDHAHLEKSTIGDRETEKCMLDSLRSKKWPKPVGGLHGLARKSFEFDPPNDVRAPTSWDSERVSDTVSKLSRKLSACKKGDAGTFEATVYVATDGSVLAAGVPPRRSRGVSRGLPGLRVEGVDAAFARELAGKGDVLAMTHREQRTFTITLNLSADFADDYAGEDDGFAWHERFQQTVRPQLVAAVYDAIRKEPRFRAVSAPRGRDPESALDLEVSYEVPKLG